MLDNILKRKKQPAIKVEAEPSAFDRAALTRRMRDVLDRPTRRELNPPQQSPEDYFQAGYSDAPAIPASIESRLPEDSLHTSEAEAAYVPPADESGHEAAFGEQSPSDHCASGHDDRDDFTDTPVDSGYSEARRPVDDVHTARA